MSLRLMSLGLMGLGLISCSSDEEPTPTATVQLRSYVSGYEEANRANRANAANRAYEPVTRAWEVPSGYSRYEDDKSISVFFTQTAAGTYEEEYFYKINSSTWKVSKTDLASATYYLYGFVPHDNSITSSVEVLSGEGKTFADGAVLKINNVPTVSNADVCVIIGAKNGTDADNDGGLTRGQFEYAAKPTSGDGKGNNNVYLLFDHLFSALRVQMRVQGDYAALRTIKLKELRLQACVGDAPTKKKTNITVTLAKTTDGSSPIAKDGEGNDMITYEPTGTEENSGIIVTSEAGIPLTTDYQPFQSHFMPVGITKLMLTSTYDVYDNDKDGNARNLVRQNCVAQNTIDISKMFSQQSSARRGARYTVNMTINPTYLYMLSEPDLNDPTVVVTE